MKKYIILSLLSFCLSVVSQAQLYLKGYTGYALSTGNEKLTSYEMLNDGYYASSHPLKFGQGANLGLSVGYVLNQNIAFEITGNTQLFSKFAYSKAFHNWDSFTSYSWSHDGFFGDLKYASTMFQVSPQVAFKANPYNQWIFYLKAGPDFIWITFKETTQTISTTDWPIPFDIYIPSYLHVNEYSGNMNTGIQGSLGMEYKLSKTICAFAELTTVNVRYTFKHSKILRYEIDGVNSLSTLESTEFNNLDDQKIFNHIGLNVGIKYIFQ